MNKPWQILKSGDIVDIIAPAGGLTENELTLSADYLKSLGLHPRFSANIFGDDLFCSNAADIRFDYLYEALCAEDSKAIWCLKGGYGTAHLIPKLNTIFPYPAHCKLVIGFSDITVLHLFLNQKWGWSTMHAPLLWESAAKRIDTKSLDILTGLIFGSIKKANFVLKPLNDITIEKIETSVTGGNLTIVQNSIGTVWQMEATGKIVLLEDIDEAPYRIDRALTHLVQADLLSGAKAIVFGTFTNSDDKKITATLEHFAENMNIPVFSLPDVGHGKTNLPMPLGTKATLTMGKQSALECEGGGQ